MTRFMINTLTDIRGGRETWRVFVAVCTPSFAITVFALTVQRLG